MDRKTLTVFTPAYNRAHTLPSTYRSLLRQTCKDFEWLIVDDGSSDNTHELVGGWKADNRIPIHYIYQENQGMHVAHNTAYENINTELNVCVDSDDYLVDDAVEIIISLWKSIKSTDVAGIIGLDILEDGTIIGESFIKDESLIHLYERPLKGDKKLVIRTDICQQTPEYPVFPGEKYVGLGYKYQLIDQDYLWLAVNRPLVVVEYQKDGSSYNMYRQWWNNPRGFAFIHNNDLKYVRSFKRRLMVATHYVSHCIRGRIPKMVSSSNDPLLVTLMIPAGFILFLYTGYKIKRNKLFSPIK